MAAYGSIGMISPVPGILLTQTKLTSHTWYRQIDSSDLKTLSQQPTNQTQARKTKVSSSIFLDSGKYWNTHLIVIPTLLGVYSENLYMRDHLLPAQKYLRHLHYRHLSGYLCRKKGLQISRLTRSAPIPPFRARIARQTLWSRLSSLLCQTTSSLFSLLISSPRDRSFCAVEITGIVLGISDKKSLYLYLTQ